MAIMDLTQLTAFDRAQIVLDRKLMTSPSDAKAEVASVINNELKKAAARRAAAQAAQLPPTPKTQEPDL